MKKHVQRLAQGIAPVAAPGLLANGVLRVVPAQSEMSVFQLRKPQPALLNGDAAVPITSDVTGIGRGLHNAVVLLDPATSREHAALMHRGGIWWVENVSRNNTLWVEERPVPAGEREPVVPGETLYLGETRLQLLASSAAYREEVLDEREQAPAGSVGEGSAIHLFNPGVTIAFALGGARSRRMIWGLGILIALLFIACAFVTLGAATLIGKDALASGGAAQALAALTIPLVPALGVSLLVAFIDRYEREPWFVLLATFLWGAVIAIPPVFFIERAILGALAHEVTGHGFPLLLRQTLFHALTAGATEEVIKGAGLFLLILLFRDEFDNITDGIIYGFLIGAGFAMVENFAYFALTPRGDLPFLILGRIVLGWLSHSTFTALFGAGLGFARETQRGRIRLWAPIVGILAAIILHTLFDTVIFGANAFAQSGDIAPSSHLFVGAALAAAYLPLFTVQAGMLALAFAALRREAEIVRTYLADEVLSDVTTPDEYMLLQNATLRARTERRLLFEYGPRAYLTGRALNQTLIGLAFRKWHVAMGDPPKRMERQPEDAYRERIAQLRRSLSRRLVEG